MLSAQGLVPAGVQASLPDLSFQLQNQRMAPLVLLLELGGNVWPSSLHPFHLLTAWGWMSHEARRYGTVSASPLSPLSLWACQAPDLFLAESWLGTIPSAVQVGMCLWAVLGTILPSAEEPSAASCTLLPAAAHADVGKAARRLH